jgi:hypothetical protein
VLANVLTGKRGNAAQDYAASAIPDASRRARRADSYRLPITLNSDSEHRALQPRQVPMVLSDEPQRSFHGDGRELHWAPLAIAAAGFA